MAKRRRALKTVFLDSSVLFTAVNSPTGGSSKLFTLKNIRLLASPIILTETERNVTKKLHKYHLDRFFMLTDKLKVIEQLSSDKHIEAAKKVIVEKDAVILAEAKSAKTDFLVTLDRKHFLTAKVSTFIKPQKVLTPKELIELSEKK